MPSLKIFVVFHQSLDQRLIFPHFTSKEISQWFIMYGVNEQKLGKVVIDKSGLENNSLENTNGVTLEYQLDVYDSEIQRQGYMETSCFLHILSNNLYPDIDFIGITQYDMRWTKKSTALLRRIADGHPRNSLLNTCTQHIRRLINPDYKVPHTVFAQIGGVVMDEAGQFNPMASVSTFNWPYLIESYNQFFGTDWKLNDLRNQPLTLWQTYLMPRELLLELSLWLKTFIKEVTPWANQPPYETHWGVLGGYTERAEAIFIALQAKSGRIIVRPLNLAHDEEIPRKLEVCKEHYAKIDAQ